MGRAIVSVIVGYLVMAVFVFGSFTAAYLLMGTDRAFEAGSYDVSMTWIVASLVLGLIAAVLGGLVCAVVAKRGSAGPKALAGLVLVLGLGLAGLHMAGVREDPGARGGEVNNVEAMKNAQQPTWMVFANPVIGCIGVLVGAGLRGKK